MQHVSVVKKWGLTDSAACECGEEVGTDRQCTWSVVKKWGLTDSAACECGEEVGTDRQCSM